MKMIIKARENVVGKMCFRFAFEMSISVAAGFHFILMCHKVGAWRNQAVGG